MTTDVKVETSGTRYAAEIHKKRDGLMMIRADSTVRFLGFWESLLWRCFRKWPADCHAEEES